ncbi:MAG: hypothetical protein SGILL_005612 [Bacillariaceae sp.]
MTMIANPQSSFPSTSDMESFDCLDFEDSLDFGKLIPEDDEHANGLFGSSIECQRSTTLDVLTETIQVCKDLDDHFGCSLSSIHDSFVMAAEISEDERSTTSSCNSEPEIEVVMQKLNSCMERSAASREHVERIAAELKKKGLHTAIPRSSSSSGVAKERRLRTSKKASKQVKKRKDFAVTGCLVRPILEKDFSATTKVTPLPRVLLPKAPQMKAVSISEFLRKGKR